MSERRLTEQEETFCDRLAELAVRLYVASPQHATHKPTPRTAAEFIEDAKVFTDEARRRILEGPRHD